MEPAKNLSNKQIEPLSDSDLLREHYKMGPAKSWTINQIESLSGDPLSGFGCMSIQLLNHNFGENTDHHCIGQGSQLG